MNSTDPIADMFTRIRNGALVNKKTITLPYSRIKEQVATILMQSGFLKSVNIEGEGVTKSLLIELAGEYENSPITEIARLSRPGRRVYVASSDIPSIKRGRGIVIVSTSEGIMTGREAKKRRLGGELIGQVY